MTDRIWRLHRGAGPLVATAIHAGHAIRAEVLRHMALDQPTRLREEDPCTARWTQVAPIRVVGLRSRFEVDLNRPRAQAIYRTPEDAWGLRVWRDELPADVAARSLAEYDAFYQALHALYAELAREHGHFVVYDLHAYNHRRAGRNGPVADPDGNPQLNLGTGTMPNRPKFARVVQRCQRDLREFNFPGGHLDVRENVKFLGGNHPRWAHETFAGSACVIAFEFKKFFMDEWTGTLDLALVDAIGQALAATVPGVLAELRRL
ncbi:MAG: N-formylglutamate amidohydrolase [Planctomycetes bacterium RBG_16_64_10]|nr:MAG: N-formylglutamate amidohydrolase [Planctomycetes bacterium RBG_16_64_10]